MSVFSNREIATMFWAILFFALVSFNKDVRTSIASLFKLALNWKIFVPFLCLVVYLAVVIWGLKKINV